MEALHQALQEQLKHARAQPPPSEPSNDVAAVQVVRKDSEGLSSDVSSFLGVPAVPVAESNEPLVPIGEDDQAPSIPPTDASLVEGSLASAPGEAPLKAEETTQHHNLPSIDEIVENDGDGLLAALKQAERAQPDVQPKAEFRKLCARFHGQRPSARRLAMDARRRKVQREAAQAPEKALKKLRKVQEKKKQFCMEL